MNSEHFSFYLCLFRDTLLETKDQPKQTVIGEICAQHVCGCCFVNVSVGMRGFVWSLF